MTTSVTEPSLSDPSPSDFGPPPKPAFAAGPVQLLAAMKLGLHLIVNERTPYGIHRDELLYLAMGRHLELWRMDFPPAIAIVAEVSRTLLGESLVGLRFFPAVFGAAIVVLAAAIARELGGSKVAQVLAGFCVLTSPLFLRAANLLQPVVMDQLIWTALLFKRLATLRTDADLFDDVDALRWAGPTEAFPAWAERIGDKRLLERCRKAANGLVSP